MKKSAGKTDFGQTNVVGMASSRELLTMTSEMAAAYLTNNRVDSSEVPAVIDRIYNKLKSLNRVQPLMAPLPEDMELSPEVNFAHFHAGRPAVSIEDSIQPDYIICLEDGVRLKMLKRHLRTAYGMTPEQYRAKWSLPPDYPMVAPNYAVVRSSHAKRIGLGKKH